MQFNQEQKLQIAQLALEKVQAHGLSVSKIAQDSGLNAGEMSFVIGRENANAPYQIKGTWDEREVNGKLQPLSDRFWSILADYVGFIIRPTYWKDFPFLNTKMITTKIEEARSTGRTAWVQGHVGMSKSKTAALYKEKNPHGTYIVKGVRVSPKAFATRIATAIGMKNVTGHTYDIADEIIRKLLNERESKPILIFDESENNSLLSWEIKKYLYDSLQGKVAIVIMSANDINEKFHKKYKAEKPVFSQIFSRFNNVLELLPVQLDEVQMVCNEFGIKSKKLQNRIFDYCTDYRILEDTIGDILMAHADGRMELTVEAFNDLYN